jgi:hypothetical protein
MKPEMLLSIVGLFCGVGSFILGVIITVKCFQKSGAAMGIVSIITCFLGGFIWGWVKCKQYQLVRFMVIWTLLWGVSIGCGGASFALMVSKPEFQKAFQKGFQEAQEKARQAREQKSP